MYLASVCLAIGLIVSAANAEGSSEENLVRLRGEIEELHRQVELKRSEHKSRQDMLVGRLTELEGQIEKEKLKTLQLQERLSVMSKQTKDNSETKLVRTQLLEQIEITKTHMNKLIPFKFAERQQNLESIASGLKDEELRLVAGVSSYVDFLDKEIRLAQSNEYFLAPIALDGKEVESEVARIGLMQMLFKSTDSRHGYLRSGKFIATEDASQVRAIIRLLKQFKQKSFSGWFEIPLSSEVTL